MLSKELEEPAERRYDLAATCDALEIGQDDDLQQQAWVIGRAAVVIIAVVLIEECQVQLMIDQVREYSKLPDRIWRSKETEIIFI